VDGTLWDDDEMQRRGVGTRTGREMGHLAQNGPGGMLEVLEQLPASARCLSTSTTPTRSSMKTRPSALELARREVAYDGMALAVRAMRPEDTAGFQEEPHD
jgi:pyrroloquinoline quinone biosynthesis protein B